MERVQIHTEYIKLDQLLKWAGAVGTGSEAKDAVAAGLVMVNGEVETRRGKKIRRGDLVKYGNNTIEVY